MVLKKESRKPSVSITAFHSEILTHDLPIKKQEYVIFILDILWTTVNMSDTYQALTRQTLMMGPEMVPETPVIVNQLTGLIAREDFIRTLKACY
jgi:hypothetical protein